MGSTHNAIIAEDITLNQKNKKDVKNVNGSLKQSLSPCINEALQIIKA
jgi:hypothetical protein